MLLFLMISFFASVIGAICGIGGGIIIKPLLDLFQMGSVSSINFLSGCTVLSMSCYSVGKSLRAGEKKVSLRLGTPLAIGAAVGGIVGKSLFETAKAAFESSSTISAVQAACLGVITIGTLIYTIFKDQIKTRKTEHLVICMIIGLALGIISSFLGIGGGPINLVILYYFFSLDTKTAAANSLYIILFSQFTSLLFSILNGAVPSFSPTGLILMVTGGITGGMIGRLLNRRLDNRDVERLFKILMIVIIGISIYNFIRCYQ